MSGSRKIKKVLRSEPTIEGAGVHLKRAFGYYQVPLFDPFLLLDDFHTSNPAHYTPGFPWHPHRGIETITYVLQGLVAHGDSLGNSGTIGPNEVQWMTAGGGIIHQEMPQETPSRTLWGMQLWANLPAAHKMMAPRYRDVKPTDMPEVTVDDGARVRILAGTVKGTRGPVRDIVIDPEYLDVTVPPGATFIHPVKPGHTVFAYVLEGQAYFDERRDAFSREMFGAGWWDTSPRCLCGHESVVLYNHVGDRVTVQTEKEPVRFLLISGHPLNEPVAWYGPIVMNTQEELRVAFEEFQNGTFIKR